MPNDQQIDSKTVFIQSLRDFLPSLRVYSDDRIEKRVGKDTLQNAADDLAGLIEVGAGQNLSKNERLALSNQCFLCLSRYIKDSLQLPVTLKTLIDSMTLIEHAVDISFPGYINSKLLKYTILSR